MLQLCYQQRAAEMAEVLGTPKRVFWILRPLGWGFRHCLPGGWAAKPKFGFLGRFFAQNFARALFFSIKSRMDS